MKHPLIFEAYPDLKDTIPWVSLGTFPTPVERLKGLGERLGHTGLWVKRDDLSSDKMGGNKVRMMEFILARAKAQGKTVAISPGPLGSNQVMASAIYGNQLGIKIIGLLFKQCPTDYMLKHMLIDKSMGAELIHVSSPYLVAFYLFYEYLKNFDWRRMKGPYIIPSLGSSATCVLGYFEAMLELKEQVNAGQCPEPDYIFVTAGTGGTMAGIEMGVRILGMNSRVVGVRITDWLSVNESLIANIVNRGYKLLKDSGARLPPLHLKGSDITMIHEFFGGEYARITPECTEAKDLARDLENIILDTTYTAKTMAAMISFIKDHGLKDKNILFWHTYNSRDLAPFLDPECTPAKLPGEFHPYFQV